MQKETQAKKVVFGGRRASWPLFAVCYLLLLLLVGLGRAQAQAPNVTYSAPLIIRQGGIYTGNYRSTDSATPVIRIETTQPVILDNCILVGPGDLINTADGTDLTIRECQGYGTTPTADNVQRGVFLYMHLGKNLLMEHNYLETNQGISLNRWSGDGSSNQTVKIRYNRVSNLDGSYRNNQQQGQACFALLNTVWNLNNIEIAWNQVINEPNKSTVGDNINFGNSGGTSASVARVHDNYVQGAYPIPATSPDFSGTGMTTDGNGQTASTTTGYLEINNNQFVSTCNGGISIAAGHDVNVHDNRVVTSGYTSSGDKLSKVYCGISAFNYYNAPTATTGNNRIANNTVGYVAWGIGIPFTNRYDIGQNALATVTGNVSLPNPITYQTEQNEWALWQQKLQQNGVTAGPTGAAVAAGAITPTIPPTPSNATFYRAFNLNGSAQLIDGNNWESGSASGLQISGGTNFNNPTLAPSPFTDGARTLMIGACTYGNNVALNVSNVPNDNYLVYLYVWEDDNPETYSIGVNGQTVQSNYRSGPANHWDRLGPFAATVSNGTLKVTATGGTANCSGLEIWKVGAPTPITPATTTTTPTTTTPTGSASTSFYRAFNLNGGATTIDNNAWEAGSAVQISGGTYFANQGIPLIPTTDSNRTAMIRSSTYGNHVQLTVPNVPNASYQVYLYVWEDNYPETFNISVNGQVAQSNYNSGAAGHWDRLGPYATTVTNGALTVNADGGTANCSGLEIWKVGSVATTNSTTSTGFYRAINLNGDALTIDGNSWEGSSAPNYSMNGNNYGLPTQQLTPSTDASRAAMIRSCRYSNNVNFNLTSVPNGTYQVYAYVWEDNFPETYSIAVNGQTMQSNLSTGTAGSWTKVGPYLTLVTNGTIQLTTTGGTVNLSGVEVWRLASVVGVASSTATTSSALATPAATALVADGSPTLYPNPLSGSQSQVSIQATLPQAQQVQVQVLTTLGVVLQKTTLNFAAGTSSQLLNVGTLPQGYYLVRLTGGSLTGTTLRLVKSD